MNLGQFCISKETFSVWQITQIKPLFIKEVSGPNTENRKVTAMDLNSKFILVEENSTQQKSIIRILDKLPLDHLDLVLIKWSNSSSAFEIVDVEDPNKQTDEIIDNLSPEEIVKKRTKIVSLIKNMVYNPNLDELREQLEKTRNKTRKNVYNIDEFREQQSEQSNKKALEYNILEPNAKYKLENLILAPETKLQMDKVVLKLELGSFLDEEWGLNQISDSSSRQPLNFQGPPGTGKTLAAKSIGLKLNKKILQVDYSQLFSKWVGESGKNIQKCFAKAQSEGLILFFDEADALLMPRHQDTTNPSNSTNQNIFMQELDKFDGIVILTTNHFQHYDEALLRRFWHVEFKLPTAEQRTELFKIHMPSKITLTPSFNWDKLATESPDFSGGDIKNVVEQALSSKATILRNENLTMPLDEFKGLLRTVIFTEIDFINEIKNISSNKHSFKNGNSKMRNKLGLVN